MGDELTPAFPPPDGTKSNFVDPENIAWKIYAAMGATLPLSTLACCLRMYTSRCIIGQWHLDDCREFISF